VPRLGPLARVGPGGPLADAVLRSLRGNGCIGRGPGWLRL